MRTARGTQEPLHGTRVALAVGDIRRRGDTLRDTRTEPPSSFRLDEIPRVRVRVRPFETPHFV